MALLTYLLGIFLVALVGLWFHLRRNHGWLETTGLPLVKPFLIFGSPPFAMHKMRYHEWFQEKYRQLGNTFARYNGVTPTICTIDPELIKEITVKQFDNFTDTLPMDSPPEQTDLTSAG